jgi:hypothetical protein
MTLIPPELDGAEGMLDQLFALFHQFRVSFHTSLGLFDEMLIYPADNPPAFFVAGAFLSQSTLTTGSGFVIADVALFFDCIKAIDQGLARRTALGVGVRIVAKLLFPKQAELGIGGGVRSSDIRFNPGFQTCFQLFTVRVAHISHRFDLLHCQHLFAG